MPNHMIKKNLEFFVTQDPYCNYNFLKNTDGAIWKKNFLKDFATWVIFYIFILKKPYL